jgi:streptogramin lyase
LVPGSDTSDNARRVRIAAGVVAVVAAVVAVLALAGVFAGGDDEEAAETPPPVRAPKTNETKPAPAPAESEPRLTTVRVGGRPTAVAADQGGVWVADSFERRATVLESEAPDARPITFSLEGPASDVTVSESGAYYALPEQQAVERRELADPESPGDAIELDGFPSVLAGIDGSVYALANKAVESIDVDTGEAADRFELTGFGSSLAAGEGFLWVAVDNREVVRIDPASGEADGDPVKVPEAFSVAADEGAVWVVSASGALTRIDPESLHATAVPAPVRGALDVAAGFGSVWVTSTERTVTRLDPRSLEPIGSALKVGDEPASVAVGEDAVWVANGGSGTLTRIVP